MPKDLLVLRLLCQNKVFPPCSFLNLCCCFFTFVHLHMHPQTSGKWPGLAKAKVLSKTPKVKQRGEWYLHPYLYTVPWSLQHAQCTCPVIESLPGFLLCLALVPVSAEFWGFDLFSLFILFASADYLPAVNAHQGSTGPIFLPSVEIKVLWLWIWWCQWSLPELWNLHLKGIVEIETAH